MSYVRAVEKQEAGADFAVRTNYRCAAQGCPNMGGIGGRFGVDRSGSCFFHHTADPMTWADVTRRIMADDNMLDPTYATPSTVADKVGSGPRAWAGLLEAREERGDSLTPAQKSMWRSARAGRTATVELT